MQVVILASNKDVASLNIKSNLLGLAAWEEYAIIDGNKCFRLQTKRHDLRLVTIDKQLIHAESLDKQIPADRYVFVSKHSSAQRVPALTVHAPGNFGVAEFGGYDKTVAIANASLIKNALRCLRENAKGVSYEVAQEATHHGPLMAKPSMFMEVGSDETGWNNPQAGRIVAASLLQALDMPDCQKTAVGIGGPHYTTNFRDAQLHSDLAIGHVCSKYYLEDLDEELLQQAMQRSSPPAQMVLLDWKGLGSHKARIVSLLKRMGIQYAKTSMYKQKF